MWYMSKRDGSSLVLWRCPGGGAEGQAPGQRKHLFDLRLCLPYCHSRAGWTLPRTWCIKHEGEREVLRSVSAGATDQVRRHKIGPWLGGGWWVSWSCSWIDGSSLVPRRRPGGWAAGQAPGRPGYRDKHNRSNLVPRRHHPDGWVEGLSAWMATAHLFSIYMDTHLIFRYCKRGWSSMKAKDRTWIYISRGAGGGFQGPWSSKMQWIKLGNSVSFRQAGGESSAWTMTARFWLLFARQKLCLTYCFSGTAMRELEDLLVDLPLRAFLSCIKSFDLVWPGLMAFVKGSIHPSYKCSVYILI